MTNLVKYGSFDLDELEKQDSQAGASTSSADFVKLKDGKNVLRFLPPKVGEKSPFMLTHEHYVKAENGESARFVCPKNQESKPCPACKMSAELRSTGNNLDRDKSFDFAPKLRVYANVVSIDDPASPKIYGFGKMVWEGLKRIRKDRDDGGDYTDPTESGFNIVINKTGENLGTRYSVTAARNNTPLEDLSVIEQQWDLNKYSAVPSMEEAIDLMQNGYQKKDYSDKPKQISDGPKMKTRRADAVIYDVDTDEVPF